MKKKKKRRETEQLYAEMFSSRESLVDFIEYIGPAVAHVSVPAGSILFLLQQAILEGREEELMYVASMTFADRILGKDPNSVLH